MKNNSRAGPGLGTRVYGLALGTALVAGFFTGVWSPAFWLVVSPLAVKGLELAKRSDP